MTIHTPQTKTAQLSPSRSPSPSSSNVSDQAPVYHPGFGNHVSSEAVAGALPLGRNSPQKPPFGLFPEQLSGTAFTAPRGENLRSWLYRLRPTANHKPFTPYPTVTALRSAPFHDGAPSPNRLRWDPLPIPDESVDFIDGLVTYAGAGDTSAQAGLAVHLYVATRPMDGRAFFDADGELLILPQQGMLTIKTEFGLIEAPPGFIAVIPRGVRFQVAVEEPSRGYVCENYGAPFRLPELGPIGSNGLANPRDFEAPSAWFEDVDQPCEIVQEFVGRLFSTILDHSPFDVVAWHGNLHPYRYDLSRFNTINTVSFDHPDPSIFTVLTSPSDTAGVANADFVIFPPRWMVAEDTFRPPWFHRNVMSEFMGLVHGAYDAKAGGFAPGGASLHNRMSGHGPDRASYEAASAADLKPHKIENALAFMFETRFVLTATRWADETPLRQLDYDDCWTGFQKANPHL